MVSANPVKLLLISLCLASLGLSPGCNSLRQSSRAAEKTCLVRYVPEMEPIPEVDGCDPPPLGADRRDTQRILQAWRRELPVLEKTLTPEKVKELSRWAKIQMGNYGLIPPLSELQLRLVGRNRDTRNWVWEGTLDTLPSHHPLVTRWLKIFLLTDERKSQISLMVVTIRGQRLE